MPLLVEKTEHKKLGWEPYLVKCLWDETYVLKVVGSNPSTIYWMDIFHILFVVKMYCLVERKKINLKVAGNGPFLKRISLTFIAFRFLPPKKVAIHSMIVMSRWWGLLSPLRICVWSQFCLKSSSDESKRSKRREAHNWHSAHTRRINWKNKLWAFATIF